MSFNPLYFFPTIITNITSLNGGVFGTVKATDVYPAVDVTDVSQSPTGTTKPYQIVQLLNFILNTQGFVTYPPLLAAATANLNATYNNGLSGVGATLTNAGTQAAFALDGQAGVLNGLYLIQFQSTPAQNGIYQLKNVGSASTDWILNRATFFNSSANIINGGLLYVQYGAMYGSTIWQDTYTAPLTVGTTAINFTEWVFAPNYGQYMQSNVLYANAISLTSTVAANITSFILPSGNWLAWGNVAINSTSGPTQVNSWLNTVSATAPDAAYQSGIGTASTGIQNAFPISPRIFVLPSPTTIYLSTLATFTGTGIAWGFLAAQPIPVI